MTENGEQGARAIWILAPGPRSWWRRDQPLAVGEDRVLALDDGARRQAALVLAQAHAAAGGDQAHAERLGLLDLDVDRVVEPVVEDVVVVARGRGAGEEQLGQGHPDREAQALLRQPRPDRIERDQPGEQRLVQRGRARRGSGSGRNGGGC